MIPTQQDRASGPSKFRTRESPPLIYTSANQQIGKQKDHKKRTREQKPPMTNVHKRYDQGSHSGGGDNATRGQAF